ncbi:hypothetical protein D3C81_1986580 [compost metagenome]
MRNLDYGDLAAISEIKAGIFGLMLSVKDEVQNCSEPGDIELAVRSLNSKLSILANQVIEMELSFIHSFQQEEKQNRPNAATLASTR